jgi:hypothetical protein
MIKEKYQHEDGTILSYNIIFKNDKVLHIYNEAGFRVEKTSHIFEFYSNKYNK